MFAQYAQRQWATHFNNAGPHIQLEEQYLPPEQTQPQPQHSPPAHDTTYSPIPLDSYHVALGNMSQRPYTDGVSLPEDSESQAPNITNIFYPQQHLFHQRSYSTEAPAQIPVQSTDASPNMRWQTGPSPQFTSSLLSTDPPSAQGANSTYYCIDAQQPQQRTLEPDWMRPTSSSQSNPGETVAGQDYLHQTKRVRPNEDDDKPSAFPVDVGMDHEVQGSQDSKGPSKTKLGACARCKNLKVCWSAQSQLLP